MTFSRDVSSVWRTFSFFVDICNCMALEDDTRGEKAFVDGAKADVEVAAATNARAAEARPYFDWNMFGFILFLFL